MKLRVSYLRREYLSGQSLTYLTAGIFLLSYVDKVKQVSFIFIIGITLCLWSFILILVAQLSHKISKKMSQLNFDAFLTPITFAALFLGIATTTNQPYVALRLLLVLFWVILWILLGGINIYKNVRIASNIRGTNRVNIFRVCLTIEYFSVGMGYLFILNKIVDPKMADAFIALNRWLYDPMFYFGIGIIFLIPILAITSMSEDK
ncbi:MAG: hypothetical protein JW967_01405 [Dehalococcoidales bacterium]|nr:hypothetical protein [Dehalococcoidales bacterium]